MTDEVLKSCPFCGATGEVNLDVGTAQVCCVNCGALGPEASYRKSSTVVWNTRTASVDELVEGANVSLFGRTVSISFDTEKEAEKAYRSITRENVGG